VVDPLENKEFLSIRLKLGPGPEQVPRISQVDTMGQFLPIGFTVERARNDVIHFRLALDNTVKQTGSTVCIDELFGQSFFYYLLTI